MICPKCQNEMKAVEYDGVEVDRCNSCQGIWFDAGESDWLRDEAAAIAIDTGDPAVGQRNNDFKTYRCPRCDGGMLRRVDLKKQHIHYEECTSCRGSFFDAGEFAGLLAAYK
jgi:Zn-finger nucleic acid-binding protein